MQEAVLKLQRLGVPPEGFESDAFPGDEGFPPEETLDLWEEYQDAADAVVRPVTWEEAEILIQCCPTDHMAGIEWTVLHCIESVLSPERVEEYRGLIERCGSDMMRAMLLKRLQNYISAREG